MNVPHISAGLIGRSRCFPSEGHPDCYRAQRPFTAIKAGRSSLWGLRTGLVVFLVMVILGQGASDARDYQVRRRAGGYTVEAFINRNPPIIGKNVTRVRIKDAHGNYVRGAVVTINYFMPPMPGMPPMNYTMPAHMTGDEYTATMDLIMTGPWNIVIIVHNRADLWRVVFPIDVR